MDGGRGQHERAAPWSGRDTAALRQIISVLHAAFGVDFGEYKAAPFGRTVARRMGVRGTAALPDYAALLVDEPNEVGVLYEDVLMHVTSFFRDAAVFAALASETLPAILTGKPANSPVRVWVAGCATGEEVYSLAILLLEVLGGRDPEHVQVIGTDVSHAAITKARSGAYSDAVLASMSPDRRERYFVRTSAGRRVNDRVYDLCSFLQHDLARDPPLAHVDLVSCRNVVMYFDRHLHRRVMERFHYALEQPGFLLLGSAEGISGSQHLFSSANDASKVFARNATASLLSFADDIEARSEARAKVERDPPEEIARPPGLARYLDRMLLAHYAPPGVLINDKMQVLEFRGRTGVYLELAPGAPSDDIMMMVCRELRSPLLEAISRAKDQMAPVRICAVPAQRDGATTTCDVVVSPLAHVPNTTECLFTVMFENPSTREERRALIDDHEKATHALRSANDDLTARNTELECINADLRHRMAAAIGSSTSMSGRRARDFDVSSSAASAGSPDATSMTS